MEYSNVITCCLCTILLWFHCASSAPTPTTVPTPTTTVQSPSDNTSDTSTLVDEVLTVPNDPHLDIYQILEIHADTLRTHHHDAYSNFLSTIFGDEDNRQIIHDLQVPNIPSSDSIPHVRERVDMSHGDLLLLHYPNLLAYQSGILAVQIDEESRHRDNRAAETEPQYLNNLRMTMIEFRRFRHRMEIAMLKEGLHEHIVRPSQVTPLEFTENTNVLERNLRNLYVLQEFNNYVTYTAMDITRILTYHILESQASDDYYSSSL